MFIYTIGAFNLNEQLLAVKIGVSADVDARISDLQTGQFYDLKLIAAWQANSRMRAFSMESEAHESFAYARLRGEWFKPTQLEPILHFLNRKMGPSCRFTGHGCKRFLRKAKKHDKADFRLDMRLICETSKFY